MPDSPRPPIDFLLLARCCATPKPLGQLCREARLDLTDDVRKRMRNLRDRGIVRWEERATTDDGEPAHPGYVLTAVGEAHLDYLHDRYGKRHEDAFERIGHPVDALMEDCP